MIPNTTVRCDLSQSFMSDSKDFSTWITCGELRCYPPGLYPLLKNESRAILVPPDWIPLGMNVIATSSNACRKYGDLIITASGVCLLGPSAR